MGVHITASKVLELLREHNSTLPEDKKLMVPTQTQLNNYNNNVKTSLNGPSGALLQQDIIDFTNKHDISKVDITDLDTPFIVFFHFNGRKDLRIGFSTHRLLQWGADEDIVTIHQDGTYKVNTDGLPCIVVGFPDKAKVFHPVIIGLSSHERQEDYSAFLKAWKSFRPGLAPTYAMSDNAGAIQNAATEIFPYVRVLMCFVHVLHNVENQAKRILSDEVRDARRVRDLFITDLLILRRAWSEECFDKVFALFMTKWLAHECQTARDVAKYVKENWYLKEKDKYWFAGAAPGYNMNNNNLESGNRYLKTFLNNTKKPWLQCCQELMGYIRVKSLARNPNEENAIVLKAVPTLRRSNWEAANRWRLSKKKEEFLRGQYEGEPFYLTVSEELSVGFTPAVGERAAQKYITGDFVSFDEFSSFFESVQVIRKCPTAKNFELMNCICSEFATSFTCRHTLGMAIRLDVKIIPPSFNVVRLKKRKRGRPSKIGRAWVRDPFAATNDDDDDAEYEEGDAAAMITQEREDVAAAVTDEQVGEGSQGEGSQRHNPRGRRNNPRYEDGASETEIDLESIGLNKINNDFSEDSDYEANDAVEQSSQKNKRKK